MNHGSLFSGIGGFDLAAQWIGWINIFQVEIDEFCQKILTKHFPETDKYRDIYEFDGTKYRGSVDIISGGFPCQPFSQAGKRQGTKDNRYLWPEMFRVITEVQPAFVIGENVAGLLSMENGRTLERILTDLENAGYRIEIFVIPACSVGAWHRRDRIWIIAYSDKFNDDNTGSGTGKISQFKKAKIFNDSDTKLESMPKRTNRWTEYQQDNGIEIRTFDSSICKDVPDTNYARNRTQGNRINRNKQEETQKGKNKSQPEFNRYGEDVPNAESKGLQRKSIGQMEESSKFAKDSKDVPDTDNTKTTRHGKYSRNLSGITEPDRPDLCGEKWWSVKSGLGGMVDGISYWSHEPDGIPRVATGIKNRVDRLKSLGNAIVPQIAFQLFKAIENINCSND